ncbi:hypothetical protein [Emticicia sp. TH156]|uniref:hypothetical protein n=1 Tax=Emticicia sp. TH156 TaxID=2067454 RepID=UPI000CA8EAC6|nr:hypothetical protein [Emticicia sp. TH156]PLK44479.1 hypothetical protein C0V77_11895 [Emticicia sp. TH156]
MKKKQPDPEPAGCYTSCWLGFIFYLPETTAMHLRRVSGFLLYSLPPNAAGRVCRAVFAGFIIKNEAFEEKTHRLLFNVAISAYYYG